MYPSRNNPNSRYPAAWQQQANRAPRSSNPAFSNLGLHTNISHTPPREAPPLPQTQQSFDDDDEWSDDESDEFIYTNDEIQNPHGFNDQNQWQGNQQQQAQHRPVIPPRSPVNGPSQVDTTYLPIDNAVSEGEIGRGFMHRSPQPRPPINSPSRFAERRPVPTPSQYPIEDSDDIYEPPVIEPRQQPPIMTPAPPYTPSKPSIVSHVDKSPIHNHTPSRLNGSDKGRTSLGRNTPFQRSNDSRASRDSLGSTSSSDHNELDIIQKPSTPMARPPKFVHHDLNVFKQQTESGGFGKLNKKILPPVSPRTQIPDKTNSPPVMSSKITSDQPRNTNSWQKNVASMDLASVLKNHHPSPSKVNPEVVRRASDAPYLQDSRFSCKDDTPARRSSYAVGNSHPSKSVEDQIWYRNVDRKYAQMQIDKNPQEGCFIVRPGRKDSPFSMTVLSHSKYFNLKIRQRQDGHYALGTEKPNERSFPSVVDMIEFYMSSSLVLAEEEGEVILAGPP